MTNPDKAQKLVANFVRSIDNERAEVTQDISKNYLLPDDPNEEPFFMVMDIDWSKYGRV